MDNSSEVVAPEASASLPSWLEALLPEPVAPQILTTVVLDGLRVLRLTDPSGHTEEFTSVADAAAVHRSSGLDLIIDPEVLTYFSENKHFLSFDRQPNGNVSVLMDYTDQRRRERLEVDYAESLEAQRRYAQSPESFPLAWEFIDSHPAFWTCADIVNHPWYWETTGYCSKLRQSVRANPEGGYRITLEGGGHVEKDLGDSYAPYSNHYGDWRVVGAAQSFERAIIDLADRVSKAFDSEGNSLPEDRFPYAEPQWVKELKERLSEEN